MSEEPFNYPLHNIKVLCTLKNKGSDMVIGLIVRFRKTQIMDMAKSACFVDVVCRHSK